MSRKMITNTRCPLCGEGVKVVPDAILNKTPHRDNCEYILTRRGLKQYIHSSCWEEMIRERRPYNGRMYV